MSQAEGNANVITDVATYSNLCISHTNFPFLALSNSKQKLK
jgi:hypothetical protein